MEKINKYIYFCDELSIFLEVLYYFTLKNNAFFTNIYFSKVFNLNNNKFDVFEKGFFNSSSNCDYKNKNKKFSKELFSFYDPCFWFILQAYGKAPDDLFYFEPNLNFDFVSDEIQLFCRKIFEHESYVRVFFFKDKSFSLYTNLNFFEPKFDFVGLWETTNLGTVFDFVVWFFLVDLSNLGPITNNDEFFYLKYVILLQYNFKNFKYGSIIYSRFNSYKIILFCLIKLGKIFKKKFENIKNKDISLKTWEEIFKDEYIKIKKIFKNF